jgi:NAD(P)-dependent dehydrogenase (short-subunit alcohol dehydrogenase family)
MSADHHRPGQLAGRVAVVTGSAQGIGQAIAVALAEAGSAVVGVDLSDQEETASRVAATGAAWSAHRVDITDEQAASRLAREVVDAHGRLDILVNNAGIDDAIGFDDLDLERWRQVIRVNLEGPFLLTKALLPLMRENGYGRIINIASGSVVNPMAGFVAYRASKMGIIGMTRALSTELGRDGVTANAVSPGVIITPMSAASLTPEFLDATVAKQGVKRPGHPSDIAAAVVFLAGPESSFVTGQTLMVNGGAAFG